MLMQDNRADQANRPLIIVGLTGMPGAGKSTAGRELESMGILRIVMGDVIREETMKRGLEANPENTGRIMLELREKYGEAAVAELSLQKIRDSKEEFVVVDGIRSTAEVEHFKRTGALFLLIAIHASRQRRFKLLSERGRSDDPLDWETFTARDERELSIGVGKVIAMADEVVSNERATPDELGKTTVDLVQKWRRSLGK
jgi:dephospho-CoA kinase